MIRKIRDLSNEYYISVLINLSAAFTYQIELQLLGYQVPRVLPATLSIQLCWCHVTPEHKYHTFNLNDKTNFTIDM